MTSTGGRAILVVDDDLALVRVLALHFESEGYEVFTAGGGAEALAHIRRHRPDVVVLDAMMPGMSGLEVCRRVRDDPGLAGAQVIILTANEGFKQSSVEAGADEFMTKPFHLHDLSGAVERAARRGVSR